MTTTGDATETTPIYRKVEDIDSGATKLFFIVCDEGWRESIVCERMYEWAADWLLDSRRQALRAGDARCGVWRDDSMTVVSDERMAVLERFGDQDVRDLCEEIRRLRREINTRGWRRENDLLRRERDLLFDKVREQGDGR